MDTTDRSTLEAKLLPELQQIAQTMGIEGSQRLRKAGLIDAIVEASANGERPGNGEATTSASRESSVAMAAVATDADGAGAPGAVATDDEAPPTPDPRAPRRARPTKDRPPTRRPATAGRRTTVVPAARIAAPTTVRAPAPGTDVPRAATATAATATTHGTDGAGPRAKSGGSSEKSAGNARSRSASKR